MSKKPVPLVYFHGDCPDGTTAAWAAWKAFDGNAEFQPLFYGRPFKFPEQTAAGRPIYMLDFCLKSPDELRRLARLASPHKLMVIDHHDSAQVRKALEAVRPDCKVFVPGRSGARLTWNHFFPERPVPPIVDYTEDRDLWLWKLKDSQVINAYLSSFPVNDPEAWNSPAEALQWGLVKKDKPTQTAILSGGEAILRFQEQCFARAEARARLYEVPVPAGGFVTVRGANVAERAFGSEVAGRLAAGKPFGFTWFYGEDGLYRFSFRRRPPVVGLEVNKLCAWFMDEKGAVSGGGHADAAGCEFSSMPSFLRNSRATMEV